MTDVVISLRDGRERLLSPRQSMVFGRCSRDDIVGLDPDDVGISSRAGAITWTRNGWLVVNLSAKRPLFIEVPGNARYRLDCGRRFAVCEHTTDVVVEGRIRRHAITITTTSQAGDGAADHGELARQPPSPSPVTVTEVEELDLSPLDFVVLVALASNRLRRFPHRGEHPLTYEQIADLLGPGSTAVAVRRRIERVREALAGQGVYTDGPQARYDLTDFLLEHRIVRPSHLALLDQHRELHP